MICSEHMATLELSSFSIPLEQGSFSGAPAGSMQRSRGMGRAGQRDASSDASESEPPASSSTTTAMPPRPTRNNSKLKVLVRSHAMREETSPPREPTPTPCITLIPSPSSSPPTIAAAGSTSPQPHHQQQPCLILSPSGSPTTIVLATPSATSPDHGDEIVTVRTQDALSSALQRKLNGNLVDSNAEVFSKSKCDLKDKCAVTKTSSSDMITNSNSSLIQSVNQKNCVKADTQRNVDTNTRARSEQIHYICDCFNQNCTKCSKNNERNINNNSNNINNNNVVSGVSSHSSNTLTVSRASVKHKLRQQSSSQGSFEGSSSTSPCLSRDSSTEQYTDTTGIDLTQFILETLNKNAKDRALMLKIEQELVGLAKDKIKTHFKFPPMSSYQRMLVHRCAAFFGMDHNIEMSGKCVVVNKTKSTRIPDLRFKDHIREDFLFPEEPRRSILKRDSNSFEDCNYKSPDRQFDNRRSKSFEEREEEYEKARRRIFKDGSMQECGSQEDFNWAEVPWPESECSKIRLLPPEQPVPKQNRLLKVQSVDGKTETLRPCVAKSYSFGGYGGSVSVLTRGDSITSTHSAGPRLLTKQDSSTSTISWRLSPSSSGYKSQSQRSDSVTPSPTATPHQLSDASGKNSLEGVDPIHQSITEETVEQAQQTDKEIETPAGDSNQLVWAVTDMQSVPKGSVLIDPQTGQPLTNQDGTIYHFDPSNPPPGFNNSKPPPSPTKTASPQKSPVKEQQPHQSPKKQQKLKTPPLKNNKSCLINSATSPSLPMTPPVQQPPQPTVHPVAYTPSTPVENPSNMPLQSYPVYPNGFVQHNVPSNDATVPVYQPQVGMVYAPYGMPPSYENRSDASITELSGYFVNMAVSDATAGQPVSYQAPSSGYWGQQPVTYYQAPANQQQQQRYPVQIPVHSQNQGTFVSTTYAPNYVPVTPNPAPVQPSTDLVPVYTNPPMQMVYPAQQPNPPNPVFIQNPNTMYVQNPIFPQGSVYPNMAYPPNTATPNPQPTNSAYTTQSFGPTTPNYNQQNQHYGQNAIGYDQRQHRTTPKNSNKQCVIPKVQNFAQAQQNSNQSSGGSNSPANTVIAGYFPNSSAPINYRQCTPPQTPPNQNIGYGYPSNYVQHSMIFRPLGGIRASPPVNIRSSRSPTPAPEYPQVGSVDRSHRYSVGPAVYHGMPCIVPGDMRLMTGRAQAPMYRQPYRQQNVTQVTNENNTGRSHKNRKPRTKVPALPPSGRQSNHSVQANTQQRF